MRLLLVEDDVGLSNTLLNGLREQAYVVDHAPDGEVALYQFAISPYDAVILDVNLPRIDGFTVCRKIREQSSAARILMLTARSQVHDRIVGLDHGADDYLTKPFEFGELLARLRALLRRHGDEMFPQNFQIADLYIDFRSHNVFRAGMLIELTTKEYTLLSYLAHHAGRFITRTELTEHVWDENHDPASNAVEVYINRLRKKLDSANRVPLIQNRRGAGYAIALPHGSEGLSD